MNKISEDEIIKRCEKLKCNGTAEPQMGSTTELLFDLLDLYKQEKEKNKKLELQLKNSDIERLRDYIKYKIECFENIMNGRLGDGARPDYQRKIDLLNEVLGESY